MIHELKNILVTCDSCRTASFTTEAKCVLSIRSGAFTAPPDWHYISVTDCGMTGYTKRDIVCPGCSGKVHYKDNDKKLIGADGYLYMG